MNWLPDCQTIFGRADTQKGVIARTTKNRLFELPATVSGIIQTRKTKIERGRKLLSEMTKVNMKTEITFVLKNRNFLFESIANNT